MEIQGSAADLMKRAMLASECRSLKARKIAGENVVDRPRRTRVRGPPEGSRGGRGDWLANEMTGAMRLDVPLKVDVAAGPNWLEVEDV